MRASKHELPADLSHFTPDLISAVAREAGLPRSHVARVVEHWLSVLRDEVWRTGKLVVPRLGTFTVRRRKQRVVADLRDPTQAHVAPELDVVKFRAAKNWRTR